ncbi:MAG: hypothetical protein ACI8XO_004265 [Verrucomicrobiales bacterium]|jgi:uncharacterized protein YbbC (DUF1343 family)
MRVSLPLDRIAETWPASLRRPDLKLGAVLHQASVNHGLRHTLEILRSHDGELFSLDALFGPQHGFAGTTQDNMIEWQGYQHPQLGIPVYSLYGEHREPTAEMLDGLDAMLVDLFDIGARYYTFIWTLYLCLRAAEKAGIPLLVADRPNPINGVTCEGELLDPDYRSFVGLHPIQVRHAMTIGELAQLFQREAFPDCELHVLPIDGWQREHWHDQTGLPWVMPSPNMPTLDSATVYPGMCLLEATNLSEGRGTTRPFELFGAPFIDSQELIADLVEKRLPGVHFRPADFEPTFQKFAGQICHGAQIHVIDRDEFLPLQTATTILDAVRQRWPDDFAWKPPPYEYETEQQPIEILAGGSLGKFFP